MYGAIASVAVVALVALFAALVMIAPPAQPPPELPDDAYWGPGDAAQQQKRRADPSVRPFKISFSAEMVMDLRTRLKNTRKLQPPLEGVGWTYGMSSDSVMTIVDHWLNKYDFKKREAHLNQYPQFLTNIQGLDIHFIHAKPQQLPKNRKIQVLPLFIQHGWPGSVVEFHKIIPLLTTPRADRDYVFEVIAPSLPGYGYSDAAAKPGLGAPEIAVLMKNLMLRLGFSEFYVQGGDWGAVVVSNMAAMFPQHVLGMHSNMCLVLRPWTYLKMFAYSLVPSLLPEDEAQRMFPMSKYFAQALEETGYLHIQATKPDTIGIGMSDSPAALAAYILEKFSSATNMANRLAKDGNLLEKFTADELIDNLMLYWAPNKAASPFRIYSETFNKKLIKYKMDNVPVTVPSACAQFEHEIIFQSRRFLEDRFLNLVRVTKIPRGGHFAAMEEPQLLADDVWESVSEMRRFKAEEERERLREQQEEM